MMITWFGQSCFRIEAKEGSILTDPFSKDIGLKPPRIKDDIITVSHQHFDHNNVGEANPEAFIIQNPGEYEKQGIAVRGIASFHDNKQGVERGPNTIYVFKAEDMTVAHLGDLGHVLTDAQIEAVGDVDMVLIPVGGTYTIDAKTAAQVIGQIEPKIIVPMHYKVPGLNVDLDGPEKFIKEMGLTPEKTDKFKITKKLLPAEEMKLVIFSF
ncbi:MAG: hypothetical protein A2941_01960 [Candidatus Yanofskybacteria bacterium RIFCSPLOWO2_01_FULL_49_17]|uniref:Lactamase n=1 Tax=Candidatus Yanofskybacteria bacterium RIFCSPLOWO2_01_FULL_49_17 TaxID=1802700 RepID=A0A1F8GSM9_9BACT|nr:MAG: hypothetical protein A2941_01960 [Candidatus Yanofskybacteria bacterium RIFCSPLOWO2_01_FULL_49_17]